MESFKSFVERKFGKFTHFFMYAMFEWLVIILLFVDGFLAFLSNEISRLFELKIPCLLCTRIDHMLVHRTSNFYYNDSICEAHKKDISSLAYCNVHKKLSDIRSMCQGCLLSFAPERDSNFDRYKSIVGILHKDLDFSVEDERKTPMKPLKKDDTEMVADEKAQFLWCSCCGETLKPRSSVKCNRSLSMNAPAPSPRAPGFAGRNNEGGNMDLPHSRYTELKLISYNESGLHDDEDATIGRGDAKAATVPLLPDSEDMNEDASRTPSSARGNKFFGISLSESPRWANKGTRKLPVEKIDFSMDPNDASEADGDILSQLKRQVTLDRRSLMALYMELDEERSASAIAANNAMAMITRLQAEKAVVQMEASQYQRMMEEQAEYDQEALQMMKDMFFKREEDIKELESELEMYRDKYGQIKKIGSEICEVDIDDDYQDMESQALSSHGDKSDCDSTTGANQIENDPDESTLDFDGERSFLLGLLRNIEEKINICSNELPSSSEFLPVEYDDEGKVPIENENKTILTREVSLFRERLKAIEAESGFLKHAAMTLHKGGAGEGTKLLNEIAQHLRKLRHFVDSSSDGMDA